MPFDTLLQGFIYFGILVFAVSGALEAARREMDILGFILIGSATGLGGGTLRDLLLGQAPVYWVRDEINIVLCIGATCLTYFAVPLIASRIRALIWMDALGLSLFCVTGTQLALSLDTPPVIAVCMGVMTATFGGIIRDVLCQTSLVLSGRELYVTVAVVGASVYLLAIKVGVEGNLALIGSVLTAFLLRGAAIIYGIKLPQYRLQK